MVDETEFESMQADEDSRLQDLHGGYIMDGHDASADIGTPPLPVGHDLPPGRYGEGGFNAGTGETAFVHEDTKQVFWRKEAFPQQPFITVIPPPPPPVPQQDPYLELLDKWEHYKKQAKHFTELENSTRRLLFIGAFPNPKEGTQNHPLPDGRTIKGDYKINRKLDEAALPSCLQALRDHGVANTDALIRYKPDLSIKEWRTLSQEAKLLFADAIVATPSLPSLEVLPPSEKKTRSRKK